jgi:cell division protein FtsI/penicillin-binding protein 2
MRGIDRRLGVLFCGFLLVFSFADARSFWLQGVRGGTLRAEAHSQQVTEVTVPGQRGRVLDRNGKVLASSEDAADVIATPYQVKNPGQTALRLHDLLGVPTPDLVSKLADPSSGFEYLARKVDADTAATIKSLNIAGVSTVPTSRRLYPQGELAAQVIGAVGTDNQGLTGLEHSENDALGGANGEQDVVHDAMGRPLRMDTVKPASVGEDIQTTIDAAIQGKTEEALSQAAEHYGAKGATAIVMNPNTGEVLAMANWPGFDPSDLQDATPDELENRATGFTYEPGSTFKAFTVASALSDHVVTPNSSFYLPSEIHVYDRTIGESHPRGPVTLTTAQILAQSSNVGAVTIGLKEGATRFSQWINRFGFGRPTAWTTRARSAASSLS